MKFQNPKFKFFLNGQTEGRTDTRMDKPKAICFHFFKVGGIKINMICKHVFNNYTCRLKFWTR